MTSSNGERQSGGGGLLSTLKDSPAVSQLGQAARDYAKARGSDAARKVGDRLSSATDSLTETSENGGFKASAVGEAAKRVAQGDNPVKAAVGGVATGVKDKVAGLFGRNRSGGAGGNKKFVSVIEDIHVGVPVDVAYDQWTQFQEFGNFTKGVESVEQADDVTTNWRAKVFKSRRSWKATVTEQIPDRRIAWTSEGAKGSTKGVVTFHPLADDLTQVLLVIEYYPQGLFEKTGNIWRAQGRRARLDLKNFRRFVMMRGEATGSWRGEIRDGEVVRSPEEVEQEEQQSGSDEEAQGQAGEQEGDEERPEDEAEADEAEGDEAEDESEDDEAEDDESDDYESDEDEADDYESDEAEDEAEDEEPEDEEPEEEEEPAAEERPARRGRRREPARAR